MLSRWDRLVLKQNHQIKSTSSASPATPLTTLPIISALLTPVSPSLDCVFTAKVPVDLGAEEVEDPDELLVADIEVLESDVEVLEPIDVNSDVSAADEVLHTPEAELVVAAAAAWLCTKP
jgi:hypothetical protein